jgi:hypothetical protein
MYLLIIDLYYKLILQPNLQIGKYILNDKSLYRFNLLRELLIKSYKRRILRICFVNYWRQVINIVRNKRKSGKWTWLCEIWYSYGGEHTLSIFSPKKGDSMFFYLQVYTASESPPPQKTSDLKLTNGHLYKCDIQCIFPSYVDPFFSVFICFRTTSLMEVGTEYIISLRTQPCW